MNSLYEHSHCVGIAVWNSSRSELVTHWFFLFVPLTSSSYWFLSCCLLFFTGSHWFLSLVTLSLVTLTSYSRWPSLTGLHSLTSTGIHLLSLATLKAEKHFPIASKKLSNGNFCVKISIETSIGNFQWETCVKLFARLNNLLTGKFSGF